MRPFRATAPVWLSLLLLASCRDGARAVFPATTLGHYASDWLVAHNRGNSHAFVHFTLTHRGRLRMTGQQVDSAVTSGVAFAKRAGPLAPVKLLFTSDTLLSVRLRAQSGASVIVQFKPAAQPSTVPVLMQVEAIP